MEGHVGGYLDEKSVNNFNRKTKESDHSGVVVVDGGIILK
jgi:hypothetical protein